MSSANMQHTCGIRMSR